MKMKIKTAMNTVLGGEITFLRSSFLLSLNDFSPKNGKTRKNLETN